MLPIYTYPGNRRRFGGIPVQRVFPSSAAEWTARFGASIGAAPIALWTYQESASPILDKIGSHHLVEFQSLLYAQAGDDLPRDNLRKSLQLDTTSATEYAGDGDTTFASLPAVGKRTLVIRFRHPDNAAAGRGLMGTGDNGSAARWGLMLNATTGAINARASDGTNTVNATGAAADDNLFHDAALTWDPDITDLLGVLLDGNAAVTAALGALVSVPAITGMRVGACVALNGQIGMQISWAALFDYVWTAAMMTAFRTPVRL